MMTDTAGTRTRDRPRRRALGRRGGRHPQGHPPRRGRQRGDRRGAGRHAGPGDPGGLRPAPRLRPLPRAHSDDRHRGHRLLGGGPGPPPRGAAGAPIREVIRPKRSQRRRGKSDPIDAYAAAGRALAGADALPVAKTGTGPCEQIRVLPARRRSAMKARARRPPADHRPAGHRPRRRAHPPRTVSAARGLIDALARTRPAPADRASAAPPGSAATGSRADEIADIDTELRALTARAAPTMLATKALRRQPPPPRSPAPTDNPGRIRTEASFAALCGAAPIPAGPREDQPPPTQPRRRPTGQPGAAPQRPARPATRAPRPAPPASPPRARAAKRYCAAPERAIARQARHPPAHPRPAPRTDDLRRGRHERGLTPRPSRPPPGHPPGPDQRTRTRHTPRHHPHRSIPPMAQHPTTTDPHRLTPIGASNPRPRPSQEPHPSHRTPAANHRTPPNPDNRQRHVAEQYDNDLPGAPRPARLSAPRPADGRRPGPAGAVRRRPPRAPPWRPPSR